MNTIDRTFVAAYDGKHGGLINAAQRRIVVVAPTLSKAVAEALAAHIRNNENLDINIILDVIVARMSVHPFRADKSSSPREF